MGISAVRPAWRRLFNFCAVDPARMVAVTLAGMTALAPMAAAANDTNLRSHAITAFGAPKYAPDFKHFDFVNPGAPKGGVLSTAAPSTGSYDSLNPFILKGVAGENLSLVYDTLMVRSLDEPATSYGLVAESVEIAPDRSSVTFFIRPQARWHDGMPMTAHDVAWSFKTLREKGHPFFANNYTEVKAVTAVDDRTVRFDLPANSNRLIPLVLGDMPVLPKHYWEKQTVTFDNSGNVKPLGSGPYRLDAFDLGNFISFRRDGDWWAKDLAINKGRYNFDRIRIDYFLDNGARFESFKAGEYNFLRENVAKRWATEYDFPAMRDGRISRESITHNEPAGMQGFVFNTRREKFQDPRVREAIAQIFNFEWGNAYLAHNAYKRSDSFFENSDLASSGIPQGREREILEQFRGKIPDRVFNEPFALPYYADKNGRPDSGMIVREKLRSSMNLLKEAGYEVRNRKMVNVKTGEPLRFEFLLISPVFERWIMPYQATLQKLGIETTLRIVDSSQYINRFQRFDYDMVVATIAGTNTPGSEQYNYWHSRSAGQAGSRNYAGVRDPVVDKLVDMLAAAETREELAACARALDRVLLHSHYVVPHYHINNYRVGYSRDLDRPRQTLDLRFDLGEFETWWSKKAGPQPPLP